MSIVLDDTSIDMLKKALSKSREHLANNEVDRADFILESISNNFNAWIDREEGICWKDQ